MSAPEHDYAVVDSEGMGSYLACSCGYCGPVRRGQTGRAQAEADADGHREAVEARAFGGGGTVAA